MNARYAVSRLVLPVLMLLLVPGTASVPATGGPDDFGYTYDANVSFSWIDIPGGTEVIGGDNQYRGPYPIDFGFYFYGRAYSEFGINTNGMVMFGIERSGGGQQSNAFVPCPATPNSFAAAFWDDLIYTPDSTIRYQTLGSAPNRYLVVEWSNVRHYSDPDHGMTFQAVVYEGSNDIKFQYLAMTHNLGGDGQSATIGIENANGRDGLGYGFNQSSIHDRLAVTFLCPRPFPTPTPSDVQDSGGPDAFGYTWSRLVPCDWVDATAGVMVPWTWDVGRGPFDIGFRFSFYGTEYDQFYISKGMVSFGRSYWTYRNIAIPSPGLPNGFAAAFWEDVWSAEESGHLYYRTFGTAPNRFLVVEWYRVGHYDDRNPAMTFEVILYEGSNDIAFQYLSMDGHNRGDGRGATIGIENQDGRIGLGVSYNQRWVRDGAAVHFYYPSDAPGTPTPTRMPPGAHRQYLPIILKRSRGVLAIALGRYSVERGLFLDYGEDVDTEVVCVSSPSVEARQTGTGRALPSWNGNQIADYYLQLRVDDGAMYAGSPTTRVRVEVEYYDQGTDTFTLEYDAFSGGPFDDGRFKNVDPVAKSDTRRFRTAVFLLCDANFANRDNGADFRISDNGDGYEIIRSISVTLMSPGPCGG
ncbi:MAG TPA: hypothetical protein VMY98_08985 [Anaerolineae bacterium]|nr:hypothetical protein [Anaerolineae bacterium]